MIDQMYTPDSRTMLINELSGGSEGSQRGGEVVIGDQKYKSVILVCKIINLLVQYLNNKQPIGR